MPRSLKFPVAKDLFCSLLSAVLLILSFPRSNFWLFAWFGFLPLLFVLENKTKARAFLFSYFTGVIFWAGIIYWLIHVTLPGTIVLILYLSIYFGIFGLIISTINYELSTINLLFIPSVWVLLEYIRSHLFTGFPWALLGHSQYLNLPVIQIADITGAWGVSFLIMMANVFIYQLIGKKQKAPFVYILSPALLLLSLCYGYYRLYPSSLVHHPSSIKISLIQGNIPQELKWAPGASSYILDKYLRLTTQAADLRPDLIVWPEASSPELLGEDNKAFGYIFSLAKKTKTPLLIGAVVKDKEEYFNSALLINSLGDITGRYDKLHLVPFGEYIPLKKILPFLETIVPIGDITAGRGYTTFKIPNRNNTNSATKISGCANVYGANNFGENFAILICFEDLFPGLSREFVKRGAQFLVNITNDAWYKKTSAAHQHLGASVFRAVENRVFLVRSANTGVSAFIASSGRIISKVSDKFGRDIFIDGIDTRQIVISKRPLTVYTSYGDIFIVICVLFVATYAVRK